MSDCPPLLPGLGPIEVVLPDLVEVRGPELSLYGVPFGEWLLVAPWVDRELHAHGIPHEHRLAS